MLVFPESAGLKAILESHGWTLYERVEAEDNPIFDYGVVQRRGPAMQYEIGKAYYLLPVVGPHETGGIKEKIGYVKVPTLFVGRQTELGRYCTLQFTPDKVLVHGVGQSIELPNGIAVAAFREGFCRNPQERAPTK